MEKLVLKFQGEPDVGETPQFCEISLQKLNEVSIVNIREKFSVLPVQGEERNHLKYNGALHSSQGLPWGKPESNLRAGVLRA